MSQQTASTRAIVLFGASEDGSNLTIAGDAIAGDAIVDCQPLPGSGLPMVTYRDGKDLVRTGGFPFRIYLEPPPAVEVVDKLPPGLRS